MAWGMFEIEQQGAVVAVHVAPVDEDSHLDVGHVLEVDCECIPKLEINVHGLPLIVHSVFAWR